MKNITKEQLISCKSKSDVCKIIGLTNNGYGMKKVNELLIKYELPLEYFIKNKYDINNPKRCKFCNNIIPKDKKRNTFCNKSCAAKFNNKSSINIEPNKCKFCSKIVKNKFCNNTCFSKYKEKIVFDKIDNNTFNLKNKITESKWIKKYLINKYGNKCMKCNWDEKNKITNKVPIQLNHIDGNSENNKLNNLELLCPNCHSLTDNYGALNTGNGRTKRKEYRIKQKEKYGFYV